jgi:F-type H+-transporting ATPase subunit b
MIRTFSIAIAVTFLVAFFVLSPQCIFAAEEAGEVADTPNPFTWASDTAVWTLIIFLTVFAILAKYAIGPIVKALDAREQGIIDNIEAAKKQNDDAKKLLDQYQAKLDASREEVRLIIETARQDAQRLGEDIVAKAREAANHERDRAVKEIESATDSALQSIAERGATLAANLAGKMIRAEVKPEQHRSLIDAALQEFTSKG